MNRNEATILVATWANGLFVVAGDACRQEMENQCVRGLAPDGRGGALVIADRHSVRRRSPSGDWATLAISECELSCCMAVGGAIYIGTDDARLLRLADGAAVLEPVESFDKTPGRETWFAGSAIVNGQRMGPPLGIRSVAANSDGSVLFVNVHVGGIPRSVDGGKTWQPTINVQSDVHEVRGHPADADLVVAASAVGLCISRDAGASWTVEREGLHAPQCYAAAFSGDDVLVSASADPFTAPGKVYRRPIRPGGAISAVEDGLPAWMKGKVDTACVATSGSKIAVVDQAGTVYLSTEFGRGWRQISAELPTPSSVLLC